MRRLTKDLPVEGRTERDRADRAARDMALEAAHADPAFLAHMSSEIRTSLNGVLSMTDMLLDSGLSPEQLRHVEILRAAGQQLLGLLEVPAVGAGQTAVGWDSCAQRRGRARTAGGDRVLLVEDNPINQAVALALLERLGYAADAVSDGREALDTLAGADYAVILMDCQMPRMDGYETTRRIRRAEPDDIRTPIIALTASALPGDREKCLAAGMDDYLSKPLSMDRLRDVLVRWLERADAAAATSEPASDPPEPPVLDKQTVAELADIPQLLARSAQRFADAGTDELDEIRRAVASGDLTHVKAVAHDLKGAAGTVGAVRLVAALEAFERACDRTPDGLEVLLDDLDRCFAEACNALAAVDASAAAQAPTTDADVTR